MTELDPAVLRFVEGRVGHPLSEAERSYLARLAAGGDKPPDEREDASLLRALGRRLVPSGERRS